MSTVIRNIDWLVAWDLPNANHVYLRDADLAFDNGLLTEIGSALTGTFDEEIEGRGKLVLPGLVNVHTHPTTETSWSPKISSHGGPPSARPSCDSRR